MEGSSFMTEVNRSEDRYDLGLLFTDGMPELDDSAGYRGVIAARAAGITYRQLDYWARTGLVEPTIRGAAGSGSQRLYGFRDILVLKLVKRLLDTGISLQQIRTAVDQLRDSGITDLAQTTLMSDGASVYLCTSIGGGHRPRQPRPGRLRHRGGQGAPRGRVEPRRARRAAGRSDGRARAAQGGPRRQLSRPPAPPRGATLQRRAPGRRACSSALRAARARARCVCCPCGQLSVFQREQLSVRTALVTMARASGLASELRTAEQPAARSPVAALLADEWPRCASGRCCPCGQLSAFQRQQLSVRTALAPVERGG